jgi:Skp family chaperone for outer membrane proteins
MTRVSLPLSVLLAAGGLLPVGYLMAPQDQAPAKFGYVDLQKVFAADARLNEDLLKIKARFDQIREGKIKAMVEEANLLKTQKDSVADRQSEKYVDALSMLGAKEAEVKAYANGIQALLEGEADARNLAAYERYRKIIAELAQKRGLEAVLRVTDPEGANREMSARLRAAELGMVLYRDAKLDITEDVITLLKASK